MSRAKLTHRLDLPSDRARLKPRREPYWRTVDGASDTGWLSVGYRRTHKGAGTWIGRHYSKAEGRTLGRLGDADDNGNRANGRTVLTCAQAVERAKRWLVETRNPSGPTTPEWTPEMAEIARHLAEGDAAEVAGKATVRWPDPNTVHRAAVEYIAANRLEWSRKQVRDTERRFRKHILPTLGRRPIADLTQKQLRAWRDGMVKASDDAEAVRRSKDSANRVLTMLKAALNHAYRDDAANAIPSNKAWLTLGPFEGVGRSRTLALTADQRQRLINATSGAFRRVVIATLLTGSRPAPGEIATCRVRHFDPDRGTIIIPTGKTGERTVPLTDAAVKWFKSITAGRDPDALLLPKDDGTAWGENHQTRPMRAAVKAAKLPNGTVMYTLRHSYATDHIMRGTAALHLAEWMGTSVKMIEDHYAHVFAAYKRGLVKQAGDLIVVEPENVAALPVPAVDV